MTLPVSRLIKVGVSLSPAAAAARNFGDLLIMGDSGVISGLERSRDYSSIEDVAAAFGTSAAEYLAALVYFSQKPQPEALTIGRWLRTASAAILNGAVLTTDQQALANFTAITTGGMKVTVDGVLKTLGSLDFHLVTNLNGVASAVTTALAGSATCVWNGSQFVITSATTGTSSTMTFAQAPSSGQDVSVLMGLTSSLALPLVPGYAAETALAAVTALCSKSTAWYGLTFGAATMPDDAANLAIAAFIEAQSVTRMFGVTVQNTNVLSSDVSNDLASELMAAGYEQTFSIYCSSNKYAAASVFGRLFTVNFDGEGTAIDLMYKQLPGITAESLETDQANVLQSKRCNVFVGYDNGTKLLQYGVMAGPVFIDETYNVDWMQNALQTAIFNVNYTSNTKVPQTDAGSNQYVTAISGVCEQAVRNGVAAPGVWSSAGFGQLQEGQFMKLGYYTFAPAIATQSQSDREARKSVAFQTAVKFAGSTQTVDLMVTFNR